MVSAGLSRVGVVNDPAPRRARSVGEPALVLFVHAVDEPTEVGVIWLRPMTAFGDWTFDECGWSELLRRELRLRGDVLAARAVCGA